MSGKSACHWSPLSDFSLSNFFVPQLPVQRSCRVVRFHYEVAFLTACSEIAILEHGQNDILQQLANVRTSKQQKLSQLTHLMHSNTPITRLPNEILAFVFECISQDAITISHVNRHWRQLALRLPSLWRNIHLGPCNDQIVEYLNRSQPVSLTITLDVNDEDLRDDDCDFYGQEYRKTHGGVIACLSMLIDHVSRWRSFHVNCASSEAMATILEYLGDLSAPYLTDVSLQMHNEDFDDPVPDWFIAIFNRGAPLLRTMHLRGMALSNCQIPPTEIVELKLDVRENFFVFILPKVFTYMPKLRALDIRGSFLWT